MDGKKTREDIMTILSGVESMERYVLDVKNDLHIEAIVIRNPKEITIDEKNHIFAIFLPVALSAFMWQDTASVRNDVFNHLFSGDVLVLVAEQDGRGVAFRSCTFLEHAGYKIMYTAGTAVSKEYQGCGIYQSLTLLFSSTVDFVVSRTQNPVVVTALARLFGHVFPVTTVPNELIRGVAIQVAQYLEMSHFDESNLVGPGFYGKLLAGTVFHSRSCEIERSMRNIICAERGDCILAVCPTK